MDFLFTFRCQFYHIAYLSLKSPHNVPLLFFIFVSIYHLRIDILYFNFSTFCCIFNVITFYFCLIFTVFMLDFLHFHERIIIFLSFINIPIFCIPLVIVFTVPFFISNTICLQFYYIFIIYLKLFVVYFLNIVFLS